MRHLMIAACTIAVIRGSLVASSGSGRQPVAAQAPAPSPASSNRLYTDAQAERGASLYRENCVFCHGPELMGTISGPAIGRAVLLAKWANKPAAELFTFVQLFMPWNSPGGLSRQQNADILAFMFKYADFPVGTTEFPAEAEAQDRISIAGGR